MAVGFSDVDFTVRPNGDLLPTPVIDPMSGIQTYRATIWLPSAAQLATLKLYLSGVTEIPGMGGGGILVVERGPGKKSLTYPTANGGEATTQAILRRIEAQVRMLVGTHIEADVEFVLVS
jgi:hypothetical protein